MDNHPIPQDVTHFQFKLIGNLTLKQFGYVGAGGISAWIAISTGAPLLIKLLLAIIFAGGGLIFAFVPIEGRPADLMLTYFFKALFQPNQYLFQKQGGTNDLVAVSNTGVQQTAVTQRVTTSVIPQQSLSQQTNTLPSGMPIMPSIQQTPSQSVLQNRQPLQKMTPPIPQMDKQQTQPPTVNPLETPTMPNIATVKQMPAVQLIQQPTPMPQQTQIVSPLDIAPPAIQTATPAIKPAEPTAPKIPQPIQQQPVQPIVRQTPLAQKPLVSPAPMTGKQEPIATAAQTPAIATANQQQPIQPMPQPKAVSATPQPQVIKPEEAIVPKPVNAQQPAPIQMDPALQQELQNTLAQKKQLEEQLAQLKKQLEQQTQPIATPPAMNVAPQAQPTGVSPVIKTMPVAQRTTQAPMVSDFPNIIMGVVKDARGNVLPNILIEVKDADDNPVRAFKTNQLGQFASATPLLNGTYTILFEDPAKKHTFDAVQIEVIGEIMQPVEVISHDEREDLRKELFGK